MIEIVRYTQRNVKRCREGDMRKRWTAARVARGRATVPRIIGYRDLARLVIAIERHAERLKLTAATTVTHTQVSESLLSDCQFTGGLRQSSTTSRACSRMGYNGW
jgi:hypothetical protein